LTSHAHVDDKERLYRLVRPNYAKFEEGKWYPSAQAFLGGPELRISVDRAKLCNYRPTYTQVDNTDYICRLLAEQVRSIDTVVKKNHKNRVIHNYKVRVDSTPQPENAAHADIYANSEEVTKGAFRLLREALAARAAWEPGFGPTTSSS
jgi:hypothetical protein